MSLAHSYIPAGRRRSGDGDDGARGASPRGDNGARGLGEQLHRTMPAGAKAMQSRPLLPRQFLLPRCASTALGGAAA